MALQVKIDPITRIEGHLAIHLSIKGTSVEHAECVGEMFRGFEIILKGRDPLDAQQITQRICGVCPVSHGIASVLAQDKAYGIMPTDNGRLMRNIILASNFLQSHIVHFYQLSALDFVDITAILNYNGKDSDLVQLKRWVNQELKSKKLFPAAPFLPRYEGDYLKSISSIKNYMTALEIRQQAHQCGAVFGGKMPHAASLIPGGVTEKISSKKIVQSFSLLKNIKSFIDNAYTDDIIAVAQHFPDYFRAGKGPGNFLCYGAFQETNDDSKKLFPSGVIIGGELQEFNVDNITEDIKYSYYSSQSGLKPLDGETTPQPDKDGAYSWLKAPRYKGAAMEVGPLSRVMVSYMKKDNVALNQLVDQMLHTLNLAPSDLVSVLGRHAARLIECKIIADRCLEWIDMLDPSKPVCTDFTIPNKGSGIGLTEAPRGALGHFLVLNNRKIQSYQCVVPTTWNCSPRDNRGTPGPVEQALVGTEIKDSENPIEATRIVRSFDPCIACAVH
ncbi:MAG: nickel-dependent hydrogenase large subunit [Proteobacteria bacterium]|nr:nickel-dependent hydrogenase large subunit [Pseudomonadota bacterium]